METILIEIRKNNDGMWVAEMVGIKLAISPLKLYVCKAVASVVELNPQVKFELEESK